MRRDPLQRPNIYEFDNFANFLKSSIDWFREQKPHFSYAVLAKSVQAPKSTVAGFIRGDRFPSYEQIRAIGKVFQWTDPEIAVSNMYCSLARSKSQDEKMFYTSQLIKSKPKAPIVLIPESKYEHVRTWLDMAVYTLLESFEGGSTAEDIFKRITFSVTLKEVEESLTKLVAFGFINDAGNGKYLPDKGYLLSSAVGSSEKHRFNVRDYQEQVLQRGIEALTCHPKDTRFISSGTLKIKEEDWPEFQNKLMEMRELLTHTFHDSNGQRAIQICFYGYQIGQSSVSLNPMKKGA